MFATVARSATDSAATPGPQNSTKQPSTPCARNSAVTCSARSVAVTPAGSRPSRWTPTTRGTCIANGSPSIAACPSTPPTPQPSTPSALTIGVWLSVPTSVSG